MSAPGDKTTSARAQPPASASWRSLTIDVEDYYHIESAYAVIPKRDWPRWPAHVEENVDRLLDLLARHRCRGTFFVLGHVAQRHPLVVPRIAAAGHEVASHGFMHDRLHRLNPATFRSDLADSKALLEDQAGQKVLGYRAPTFSVTPATAWAVDVLLECGFQYDASIFPVHHPLYGVPDAPDRPYLVQSSPDRPTLLEIPPLTWKWGSKKLAVAGGGYFRLLPLWFMRQGLARATTENRPAVLYFHPWEFDPNLPKMPLSFTGRLRTYTGLRTAAARLETILESPATWRRLGDQLDDLRQRAQTLPPYPLAAAHPPHPPHPAHRAN